MSEKETPKLDRSQKVILIALASVSDIGNKRIIRLIELFDTPERILSAPAGEISNVLKVPISVGKEVAKAGRNLEKAEKILSRTESLGARYISIWDEDFPSRLKKIPNPPFAIYFLGETSPLYDYSLAIVGTRTASSHGLRLSFSISREIASCGVTIVSGMATGVDTKAHEGALEAGGRTIAVLGSGIDVIYPSSNRKLYEKIVQRGAVISEYPPGMDPDTHHFPQRNRIISGISIGTAVIEAGHKSGALITAKIAIEQGRELFACPGNAGLLKNAGTNKLLKEGVSHFVENGQDIIDILRSQLAPILNISAALTLPDMNETEMKLYKLLENGARQIDDIVRNIGKSIIEVNQVMTSMQIKGIIRQIPGARIERV